MLVDLDVLLVAEFCQVQGPTVITSFPDFPCISGYTFRETEGIYSTLLLKTMSMNYPSLPTAEALPGMYNNDICVCVSYPLLTLIDKTDPALFPNHKHSERRVLHVISLSSFLPDISARGYVRKLALLYLSFDTKKIDHMSHSIMFALSEAFGIVKHAATLTTRLDLARYVVGLNQSVTDLTRVQAVLEDTPLEEAAIKDRLAREGFSADFITKVSFYAMNQVLPTVISSIETFRHDAIESFALLQARSFPSVLLAAMSPRLAPYFACPYAELLNQPEMAKLMMEILVPSDALTAADIDAVYSPLLTQSIASILEHSPHIVLCNSHDLYVTAKQPLRQLDAYIDPLLLLLFYETLEKIYAFYRVSLIDILATEQCQDSGIILKFGEVFRFPGAELQDSLSFTGDVLNNGLVITMNRFDPAALEASGFRLLSNPRRILAVPGKCSHKYDMLMTTKWLFLYSYAAPKQPGPLLWADLASDPDTLKTRLGHLRKPCIHKAMHYNHEFKAGHLLFYLYNLLSPRIFNNICTAVLQGKLLVLLSSSLVNSQIIISALSIFSVELLVQVEDGSLRPHMHREWRSIDRLKLTVKFFQDLAEFEEYCLNVAKLREPGYATVVVFCTDTHSPPAESPASKQSSPGMRETRLAEDPQPLKVSDLYASSFASVSQLHSGVALSRLMNTGPSQSVFADDLTCGDLEAIDDPPTTSVTFLEDLFEKLFTDSSHDLYAALHTTGEAKGLMISDCRVRYWPVEKNNCTVVRSVTKYFPGAGARSNSSKIGVSNDFVSRRLQNALSRFFCSFLSGQYQVEREFDHYRPDAIDGYFAERPGEQPQSHKGHEADSAAQRLELRLRQGDARIRPRFEAAFMLANGARPDDVARVWNSAIYYRDDGCMSMSSSNIFASMSELPIPVLLANSGRSRIIDEQTIHMEIPDLYKLMKELGIDPIERPV